MGPHDKATELCGSLDFPHAAATPRDNAPGQAEASSDAASVSLIDGVYDGDVPVALNEHCTENKSNADRETHAGNGNIHVRNSQTQDPLASGNSPTQSAVSLASKKPPVADRRARNQLYVHRGPLPTASGSNIPEQFLKIIEWKFIENLAWKAVQARYNEEYDDELSYVAMQKHAQTYGDEWFLEQGLQQPWATLLAEQKRCLEMDYPGIDEAEYYKNSEIRAMSRAAARARIRAARRRAAPSKKAKAKSKRKQREDSDDDDTDYKPHGQAPSKRRRIRGNPRLNRPADPFGSVNPQSHHVEDSLEGDSAVPPQSKTQLYSTPSGDKKISNDTFSNDTFSNDTFSSETHSNNPFLNDGISYPGISDDRIRGYPQHPSQEASPDLALKNIQHQNQEAQSPNPNTAISNASNAIAKYQADLGVHHLTGKSRVKFGGAGDQTMNGPGYMTSIDHMYTKGDDGYGNEVDLYWAHEKPGFDWEFEASE